MSFLGKFLRKKEDARKVEKLKKQVEKNAEASQKRVNEPVAKTGTESTRQVQGTIIAGVLRSPHITEKTVASSERGTYVFSIAAGVNKLEIARAVSARYNVTVRKVTIVNLPGKERRRGKQIGWKAGLRKAMVTVMSGQKIEIQ